MQLVRISGPTDAMRRLGEVAGVDFERSSASKLDDDTWQVAGYANDEGLAELEARGLVAEVVVPAGQLAEERRVLFASITRDEGDGAPAGGDPDPAADDDEPEAGT